ncbi:hypothetical protein ACFXGT_15330 [Streptomyces sp. NPDC059352]|uniref:hypothetical protein n=1 Tax=Streptomyces sp. NPDC059352 TaxID=3346810 RepID=UPI0036C8776E
MSAQTTPPAGERDTELSASAATGGVITIALFIVLFFVGGFLNAEIPQPDAPLKEITDWRGDNGSAIRLAGALFMTSVVLGGPVVVVGSALLVVVGAVSLLRAKLLPTWLGGLGVVIGLIDLAALCSVLPESVDMMILLPIGRFTSMAWLLMATVVVTRKLGKARS